jgi:hypothetical protein
MFRIIPRELFSYHIIPFFFDPKDSVVRREIDGAVIIHHINPYNGLPHGSYSFNSNKYTINKMFVNGFIHGRMTKICKLYTSTNFYEYMYDHGLCISVNRYLIENGMKKLSSRSTFSKDTFDVNNASYMNYNKNCFIEILRFPDRRDVFFKTSIEYEGEPNSHT